MNVVLSDCMLDVVLLRTVVPVAVELMQLHCHLSQLLAIEAFVDLTETTLPQQAQQLVFADTWPATIASGLQPPIARMLLLVK